jgi:hypothetical protein
MEVSGQLHAPAALPPGKDHPVPIWWKAGWAPEPIWTQQWRREKFPAHAGTRTPIVQSPYRLVTILAELSRLGRILVPQQKNINCDSAELNYLIYSRKVQLLISKVYLQQMCDVKSKLENVTGFQDYFYNHRNIQKKKKQVFHSVSELRMRR